MTTIEPVADVLPSTAVETVAGTFGKIDALLRRVGDRLNPLLIKECRQALKGRQFAATFVLLLFGSWFWSLAGIAAIGPEAYYTPVGPTMFYGYYLLLAFPLTVIVPYGAFRSMGSECEDRSFELVSITTLGPRQIIAGKIGSVLMQMLVYLSAVSPCLAFTYLLRGIDIISAGTFMVYLILGSVGLSMISILLATVAREKHTQVAVSILLLIGLVITFIVVFQLVASFVFFASLPTDEPDFWTFNAAVLTGYVTYFALLFFVAAGQITFSSDNRSTAARVVLVVQQMLYTGWWAWAAWRWHSLNDSAGLVIVATTFLGIHWFLVGIFLVAEPDNLSRRIRRSLPQSFFGRVFLTWFNPGPGTGYVFVIANLFAAFVLGEFCVLAISGPSLTKANAGLIVASGLCFLVLGLSYIVIYLGISKWIIAWLRRYVGVGPLLAVLVPFLLLLVGVAGPLILYAMSAQRGLGYSMLQITNPFWTLAEVASPNPPAGEIYLVMVLLLVASVIVFVINLPSIAREVVKVRIATPRRVVEEN